MIEISSSLAVNFMNCTWSVRKGTKWAALQNPRIKMKNQWDTKMLLHKETEEALGGAVESNSKLAYL